MDNNTNSNDPIPFEADPQPAPRIQPSAAPIGGGIKKGLAPLSLDGKEPTIVSSSKIQTFESTSTLKKVDEVEFKRPVNKNGQGATRIRTFHTKLNDGAFHFLDNLINEWIDSNPDVEVKFCSTSIGVVEGKKLEPHVIINVWY